MVPRTIESAGERFFLIGPQKTGTTWLYECLREHPQLFLPSRVKETFYFERYFDRGQAWYERYFAQAKPGQTVGEVAPTYFGDDAVPGRIHSHYPRARIVATFRSPLSRAWSMYQHHLRRGDVGNNFERAAIAYPRILTDGLFAKHLQDYQRVFGENVSIFIFEDFEADSHASLARLFRTLGVSDDFVPDAIRQRVNDADTATFGPLAVLITRASRVAHRLGLHELVSAGKSLGLRRLAFRPAAERSGPSAELRAFLMDYYQEDVARLSDLLGRDLGTIWFAAR